MGNIKHHSDNQLSLTGTPTGVVSMRDVLQIDESRDTPTVRRWTVGPLALEVVIDTPDDGPADVTLSARWYR